MVFRCKESSECQESIQADILRAVLSSKNFIKHILLNIERILFEIEHVNQTSFSSSWAFKDNLEYVT